MPDTKLTDLEILTEPANGDVLYIVDVDQDKSKQITFANLIGTKFDQLSTDFDTLTSNLQVDIDANADNITTAQNDIITNTTNIAELSTTTNRVSSFVTALSTAIFPTVLTISAVDTGNFSFGTAMTVSSASTITQHIDTNNTELGDIGWVALSAAGGLSGLQTNYYPISTNSFEFILNSRANDDRSIVIPANTVFTYFVTRNVTNDNFS